jgi:hypothetical protein
MLSNQTSYDIGLEDRSSPSLKYDETYVSSTLIEYWYSGLLHRGNLQVSKALTSQIVAQFESSAPATEARMPSPKPL